MARPALEALEKKSVRLTVRFRPDEMKELESQSEINGLSLSELIRRRSLQKRVTPVTDLKTISELRKIGGLLKLSFSETGGLYRQKTAALLDELQAAILRVGKVEKEGKRGNDDR
jgi:hypothetical protein